MGNVVSILLATAGICGVFSIGCLVADYVFPKWNWLNKYIDQLPMMHK